MCSFAAAFTTYFRRRAMAAIEELDSVGALRAAGIVGAGAAAT